MDNAQVQMFITTLQQMTREHGHVYLSTGCLHDDHDYCNAKTGAVGPKAPAECKFCTAKCICPCHGSSSGTN